MRPLNTLVASAILLRPVLPMTAEWIPASDSASLPMSKNYRDELRVRLSKIDMNSIGVEERANMERLKRALDSEEGSPGRAFPTVVPYITVGILTILAYWVYTLRAQTIPSAEEIRRARELKYQ